MGKFILFAEETNIFVYGDSQEIAVQKANLTLTSVSSICMQTRCILKLLLYAF